jgi:hypothetical protein
MHIYRTKEKDKKTPEVGLIHSAPLTSQQNKKDGLRDREKPTKITDNNLAQR